MSLRLPVEHAHHATRTGPITREFRGSVLQLAGLVGLLSFTASCGAGVAVASIAQRKYLLLGVTVLLGVAFAFLAHRFWWTLRARVFVGDGGICVVRGRYAHSLAWRDVQYVEALTQRREKGILGLCGEEKVVVNLELHGLDAGAPMIIPDTLASFRELVQELRDRGLVSAPR